MKLGNLYVSFPSIFALLRNKITSARSVQCETFWGFEKDVNNGRVKGGSQLISGQYSTNRLVGVKSHMATNWIYIIRNTTHYRLPLHVQLHVTPTFGWPIKSWLYLKNYFSNTFYTYVSYALSAGGARKFIFTLDPETFQTTPVSRHVKLITLYFRIIESSLTTEICVAVTNHYE